MVCGKHASLSSVSDLDLRERLSAAVSTERAASTDVVFHLAELDRRKLYLEDACSSLFAYCVERLGYSEDGANKRVRVARLAQRFPQILDELASGEVHLTGLFLLSRHLTGTTSSSSWPKRVGSRSVSSKSSSPAGLRSRMCRPP
ncbi:MAG: hypothetical protein IPI67_07755 [Myxococcales bacterium]|nr:hypothetical protein [Myxococcales bacterium]